MLGLLSVPLLAQTPNRGAKTDSADPESAEGFAGKDAEKQKILEWKRQTLVGAYDQVGRKNAKWDEAARKALEAFARLDVDSDRDQILGLLATNYTAAIAAGCDDPLILYARARYLPRGERMTLSGRADAYRQAADGMEGSRYSSYWKFFATVLASAQLRARDGANASPEADRFWRMATNHLQSALSDSSIPAAEIYDACNTAFRNSAAGDDEAAYECFEKPLFRKWPNDSLPWLIKGNAFIEFAWHARGRGFIETVTAEGGKGFSRNLAVAEEALGQAWKLNTNDVRIPRAMMRVELGQGKGRDRMELWFQRAMAIDPNNYDVCEAKRFYLEPRWHGSAEDMVAFGRECVQSKQWGGKIPLILVAAHKAIPVYLEDPERTNYWKQPEVWPDIKSAYEKYFANHQNDSIQRQEYAVLAFKCEQWAEFSRQVPLFGTVDYSIFGGRRAYERMVRQANLLSGAPRGGRRGRRN
jgi:hypothetical protein